MKKARKMSPLLPELITDILLCLPVSSLLRFRCLSRSLCAEIDSEIFVKNHLKRSIQTKTRQKLVIYFDSMFSQRNDFYYTDFDDDLVEAFPLNNPLISRRNASSIYGSCNGLILLGMHLAMWNGFIPLGMDLAIWNPFTRRYKKLPPCPVQTLTGYRGFLGSGLGYDSAQDDYKIVMLSEMQDSNRVCFQVWVYGLKSDIWKRSQDLGDRVSTRVGCFAGGTLYWPRKNKCVGFDLAKEVFFDIPQPFDCGPATLFLDCFVDFGGNLYCPILHDGTVECFLLVSDNKGGEVVGVSWQKEFTMGNWETVLVDVFPPWPLAYSKDRNSILLGEEMGVFWYNLESRTKQRVNITGLPGLPGYSCNVCWESLVSVGKDDAFDGAAKGVII